MKEKKERGRKEREARAIRNPGRQEASIPMGLFADTCVRSEKRFRVLPSHVSLPLTYLERDNVPSLSSKNFFFFNKGLVLFLAESRPIVKKKGYISLKW